MKKNRFVEVVIDKYIDQTFDYLYPDFLEEPLPGTFVLVSFKKKELQACIIKIKKHSLVDTAKLKPVISVIDSIPPVSKNMLQLAFWMRDYYGSPLGVIIRNIAPAYIFKERKRKKRDSLTSHVLTSRKNISLNEEQEKALTIINSKIDDEKSNVFLLWGVTGSGKTEVFLRVIEQVLARGKSALIIVPEIALTPQLSEIFISYFNEPVAILHSNFNDLERAENWRKVARGEIKIVLGARSAIFAPLKNIGIIVVDEEHEKTFKQEEAPRYNARDVAILRGQMEKSLVVLSSATPSLESFYNASIEKYKLLSLPNRVSKQKLPDVTLVNMEKEFQQHKVQYIFSSQLLSAIEQRLKLKEQTILLLNRRGFSTCLMCNSCGFMLKCSSCSILMTYHKSRDELICHHCQQTKKPLLKCPECNHSKMNYVGFGTEKVEKQLNKIFPFAKIARVDTDVIKKKGALESILKDFASGKTDVLIGTQMIAKGLDIENVTLVGVLAADLALNMPNFRAGETTFQLLTQVAGRAGRGKREGKVFIQAGAVDNPILKHAINQDYFKFYQEEIFYRQKFNYPPFSRFILITIFDKNEKNSFNLASSFSAKLVNVVEPGKSRFYPVVKSPIEKINNRFRHQLLISTSHIKYLVSCIHFAINNYFLKKKKHFLVDVDPSSMM